MSTDAWELRTDGSAFSVEEHIYGNADDKNFDDDSVLASFIILTNSGNISTANYIIDIWLALRFIRVTNYIKYSISELIDLAVIDYASNLSYHLSKPQYLKIHNDQNNYTVETLIDFINAVNRDMTTIHTQIADAFNQQFCQVRYGGLYIGTLGNPNLCFKISSSEFNWADIIYDFTSSFSRTRRVDDISICRNIDVDGGAMGDELYYVAGDGTPYNQMPLDEYLTDEHGYADII